MRNVTLRRKIIRLTIAGLLMYFAAEFFSPVHWHPVLKGTGLHYSVTDIGVFSAYDNPFKMLINDEGLVAFSATGFPGHACEYQNGRLKLIPIPAGFIGLSPMAINNNGWLVCCLIDTTSDTPTVVVRHGKICLFTRTGGCAYWIDSANRILCDVVTGSGAVEPMIWDNGRWLHYTFPGLPRSSQVIMSPNGVEYGAYITEGQPSSTVWADDHGVIRQRGDFSGLSVLCAANDAGEIVGGDGEYVPGYLLQKGHFVSLQTLGGDMSFPYGINEQGQIVGKAELITWVLAGTLLQPIHACLWQKGRVYDLNDCIPQGSGWELTSAEAINNRGQIVCIGERHLEDNSLERHCLLLTPSR